jgi:hypothetical protein
VLGPELSRAYDSAVMPESYSASGALGSQDALIQLDGWLPWGLM